MPVSAGIMRSVELQPRIFVAGHRGLLGKALVRALERRGRHHVLTAPREMLDLTRQEAVERFFEQERPDYVLLAAGQVGGIAANRRFAADFIRTNLSIETNVLEMAHRTEVKGLVLFGSSCMYPREAPQPLREDMLLTGPMEPTSQAYAISKIAGVELCRAYRRQHGRRFFTMVPATLYGPHDHYDSERSHVIPALVSRFLAAREAGEKTVTVLGSGSPRREFLHCDDAADAAIFLLEKGTDLDIVNVGSGEEVSIAELAARIASLLRFEGKIVFDPSAPDGAPRKLLDSEHIRTLGWRPKIRLEEGLASALGWYLRARSRALDPAHTREGSPSHTFS